MNVLRRLQTKFHDEDGRQPRCELDRLPFLVLNRGFALISRVMVSARCRRLVPSALTCIHASRRLRRSSGQQSQTRLAVARRLQHHLPPAVLCLPCFHPKDYLLRLWEDQCQLWPRSTARKDPRKDCRIPSRLGRSLRRRVELGVVVLQQVDRGREGEGSTSTKPSSSSFVKRCEKPLRQLSHSQNLRVRSVVPRR